MASEEVKVKRAALLPCMSCNICNKIMRDATTVIECLHSFCSKCIYKKLEDEGLNVCPECGVDLGAAPLDKLRPDHNLQALIVNAFPDKKKKNVEVKAAEVVTPAATSPKRREKCRSLSALGISSPQVQATVEVKGERTKPATAKKGSGTRFTQKKCMINDDESTEFRNESSTSHEMVNKYTRRMRQNPAASGSSADMERGNNFQNSERQSEADASKLLNCQEEEASGSKPLRKGSQEPFAKPGALDPQDSDQGASARGDSPAEPECAKKTRRNRRKSKNSGDIKMSTPQAVVNASGLKLDQINQPIWFSLVASDKKKVDSQLPQISPMYIRIKDVRMPASYIQKYLTAKLNLRSENEVEIRCAGQLVDPMLPLNELLAFWLRTLTTERVAVTVGSSAKEFVMPINYARRLQ